MIARLAALLAVGLLFGCRATNELEQQTLPFHVAVVPPPPALVGTASPGEHPGEPSELALALTAGDVARAMSEGLDEYCFARVTALEETGAEEQDAFVRQSALLEEAVASGADLIVEFGLRFDREVYRSASSTSWLNYPLFLFAGPSHWFVADQTYHADVELTAAVYDVQALLAGEGALGDPSARVLLSVARFTEAELDFTDRAESGTDYVRALVVPSAWLAHETAEASAELEAAIVEQLRTRLVQGVQSRRDELVRAAEVAPAFLEPEDVAIESDGEELVVRGLVHLREGALTHRVHAVHLDAGAGEVVVEPVSAEATVEGHRAAAFEARVPRASGGGVLRLRVVAGARDRYVRTYTFPVAG